MFGHGFNIRFGYIEAPEGVDVVMVAPKGPGHTVRREYEAGRGVPVIVAVEKDASGNAWPLVLSYAKAIGGLRAGGIKTTFTEETETDLFGEQAVLCGGVSQLVQYGFETLTEAGYQPQVAYFEVLHELKLIVDLMWEGGIAKQRWSVSDTAEYGDYVSGPRVIDPHVKENMQAVLADIQSGAFAERFIADQDNGAQGVPRAPRKGEAHPIEATGRELRKLFAWNASNDDDYVDGVLDDDAPRHGEGHLEAIGDEGNPGASRTRSRSHHHHAVEDDRSSVLKVADAGSPSSHRATPLRRRTSRAGSGRHDSATGAGTRLPRRGPPPPVRADRSRTDPYECPPC